MISKLSDSKTWIAREHDRPAGMEIQLLKRTLVLPWSQFLYAEGDDERISVTFATHGISISGCRPPISPDRSMQPARQPAARAGTS